MRQRPDLPCFHEHDIIGVLHFPFDEQKRLLCNHEPDAFKQIGRHDRIRHPGLILQADEDKSLRRARSLTTNHVSRNLQSRSMARLDQIGRPPDARQLFPQQFHRMRTGREVHPFIIRLDPF
jgi:hypothetical protein